MAQVHGDWGVIEASWSVGQVVSLEAVLVVPLLSLFWDESAHLIIVSSSKDLIYGFLRDDAIDRSFLQHLVVITGGWFEDVLPYAGNQSSYEVSIGGGVSKRVSSFSG